MKSEELLILQKMDPEASSIAVVWAADGGAAPTLTEGAADTRQKSATSSGALGPLGVTGSRVDGGRWEGGWSLSGRRTGVDVAFQNVANANASTYCA